MHEFLAVRVSDAMTPDPIVIEPATTLAEVEAIFAVYNFNGLPVVGPRNRLLGVLTKLDVLKAFRFTPGSLIPPYEETMSRTVEPFMTREPVTVTPSTPLTRVLEEMVRTRYKSLPVVQAGRLVGIVAREDVLAALRRVAGSASVPAGAGRASRSLGR